MSETWIEGRPDFADHSFGQTRIAKHPKYVYGTSHQAMQEKDLGVESKTPVH